MLLHVGKNPSRFYEKKSLISIRRRRNVNHKPIKVTFRQILNRFFFLNFHLKSKFPIKSHIYRGGENIEHCSLFVLAALIFENDDENTEIASHKNC